MKITSGLLSFNGIGASGGKRTPRRLLGLVRLSLVLALVLAAPGASLALDMFLKCKGIDGESQDDKFRGASDVLAWSWGMSQTGTTHAGGGGGAGKVSFEDLSVTKYIDTATTKLMERCASGAHIDEVVLSVRRPGGREQMYLRITLKDVIVTSLSTGASGVDVNRLTEKVTFNFAEVKVEYYQVDDEGKVLPPTEFGWDLKTNKEA